MFDIRKILEGFGLSEESVDQVKLGRGVVGKVTYVAMAAVAVLGLIAWRLTDESYLILVAGSTILIFIVYSIGILLFARSNPGAALLEGAELLRWKKYDLASKNHPAPRENRTIADPRAQHLLGFDPENPDENG